MSVYRDTEGTVIFNHPIGAALTASVVSDAGQTPWVSDPITPTSGGTYTLTIPWQLTEYDAKLTITWTDGNGFSRVQATKVVTPLLTTAQLTDVFTGSGTTFDGDLTEVEATVRAVIETYCGQPFGYSVGSREYIGNGSGKFILNERCASLTGILGGWSFVPAGPGNENGELNLERAGLIQDGWTVLIQWPEYLTIKECPPMELINFAPSQDGTIRVPRRFYAQRDLGVHYTLNGAWGYEVVPEEVQEAAALLVNDYAAGDSEYRDRYLSILKIQQDSFTYHPGAFRGTGNARADLLLGPFRRQSGMIIL